MVIIIVNAYFNVNWYHVASPKQLQQFTFVWVLIEIFFNAVSLAFIDKADLSNPLERKQY